MNISCVFLMRILLELVEKHLPNMSDFAPYIAMNMFSVFI